jgi:hypothetical protein
MVIKVNGTTFIIISYGPIDKTLNGSRKYSISFLHYQILQILIKS